MADVSFSIRAFSGAHVGDRFERFELEPLALRWKIQHAHRVVRRSINASEISAATKETPSDCLYKVSRRDIGHLLHLRRISGRRGLADHNCKRRDVHGGIQHIMYLGCQVLGLEVTPIADIANYRDVIAIVE